VPSLVLGPLLRHVGEHDATVWVEVDGPCEVEVLGHRARTFHVEGHHYGLVVVDGLEPGGARPYEVALDGERAWPPPESPFPPSSIRTIRDGDPVRVLFGSCRVGYPHEDPYTRSPDEHECGRGHDALRAYARRMLDEPPERWPSALFLVGDQVYADEVSPATLAFIRSRRDTSRPPGEEVADFEEYTHLYREAWSDPVIRWVLSTVSTAMLFDDHDVHDDWNISHGWLEDIRREPWWNERIVGAFVSYWLYQHLGNLSPAQLRGDELFARAHEVDDAGPLLRDFAFRSDRETKGRRWSFCRDLGRTRVLAIDCRAGRVLDPDRRLMVDDEEWDWICDTVEGDFHHLLLAMSDPFLLAPGIHDFQAWNNAVCEGAWGRLAERPAEWLRRTADLDHWASFPRAFDRLTNLLREVGSGRRGAAPKTIVALSGDVHNAYLAEVGFPRGSGVTSAVYQAVCSPIRNPLPSLERRGQRFGTTRAATAIGRLLRASARVPPPDIRWRTVRGPTFENQIATLELDGGSAHLRVETPVDRENGRLELRPVWDYRLAASS
jgi:PhoD-like phosphatase